MASAGRRARDANAGFKATPEGCKPSTTAGPGRATPQPLGKARYCARSRNKDKSNPESVNDEVIGSPSASRYRSSSMSWLPMNAPSTGCWVPWRRICRDSSPAKYCAKLLCWPTRAPPTGFPMVLTVSGNSCCRPIASWYELMYGRPKWWLAVFVGTARKTSNTLRERSCSSQRLISHASFCGSTSEDRRNKKCKTRDQPRLRCPVPPSSRLSQQPSSLIGLRLLPPALDVSVTVSRTVTRCPRSGQLLRITEIPHSRSPKFPRGRAAWRA